MVKSARALELAAERAVRRSRLRSAGRARDRGRLKNTIANINNSVSGGTDLRAPLRNIINGARRVVRRGGLFDPLFARLRVGGYLYTMRRRLLFIISAVHGRLRRPIHGDFRRGGSFFWYLDLRRAQDL